MGDTGEDGGGGITVDLLGNVITTGYFTGTVDFDPGPASQPVVSNGQSDIFIQKLGAPGNLLWLQTMGGSDDDQGFDIITDPAGNIFSTGGFVDTVDFDPGAGVYELGAPPQVIGALYVQALEPNGNFSWARSVGTAYGRAIALDNNGNVLLTGTFADTADFDPGPDTTTLIANGGADIFVLKLDGAGEFDWAARMGGSTIDDYGYAIGTDDDGNVYTTGSFNGTADFNPGSSSNNLSAQGTDIFIQKLTPAGAYGWARRIGSQDHDEARALAVTGTGNVFITGSFEDEVDFDFNSGITKLESDGANPDEFVLKVQQYSCPVPAQPGIITGDGGVCHASQQTYFIAPVAGASSYTWSFPGGGWNTNGGSVDTTITATANGNSGNIGVTANNNCGSSSQRTKAVTVSLEGILVWRSNNTLYTSPGYPLYTWFRDSVLLGTTTVNNYLLSQTGVYYVYVTDALGCDLYSNTDTVLALGVSGLGAVLPLQLYPSPNNGSFTIDGSGLKDGTVGIEITDVTGRTIRTESLVVKNGRVLREIRLDRPSAGLYLLKLTAETGTQVLRFVVE
jgi:hypothetical protein